MTGNEFAHALPFPLVCASIVACVAAMVLMSLASHGRCEHAWGELVLSGSALCLVLALIVAWTTA